MSRGTYPDCGFRSCWNMGDPCPPSCGRHPRKSELTELTTYDESCLTAAAGTAGLVIDAETIGPMSYTGMLTLRDAVKEVPNRPSMTSQFRIDIMRAWQAAKRTS